MDIVLGVSMTPTAVRMVLVEGEKGDGATVDHDVFEVAGSDDSATLSVADQVVQAVLGTQESAQAGGHHLKAIGVTWTDHTDASALREALAAHGINDVMLVSELHAAGALAQAAGRAVGYNSTALLFLNRDTATLSVVRAEDGSVVKVLSRSLHSTDAMAVLGEMAAAVAGQDTAPEGMFVVGSGVDVASVKEHLAALVDIPVSAPEESGLALARGAALASASAPAFEASTVGLAYSLDPDGPTAGSVLAAAADTQLAASSVPNYAEVPDDLAGLDVEPPIEQGPKPFLLVGSMASIFVIGVVALAISLAVSIRPTADERPAPARAAVAPSAQAPAPAPVPEALPVQPAPPPPPAAAETIKAPIRVVQQAPQQAPRQVYVERAPAPQAPAPAPAPVAPPPAPAPVAPPVVPPVWTPPVVLPPPVIVLPRPQWPVWRPPWEQKPRQTQQPQYPDYDDDDYPGYPPQQPQQPQPQQPQPQQPQQPQWPWPTGGNGGNGGNGSGSGNSEGSRGDSGSRGDYGRGDYGRGDSGSGQGGQGGGQGGNCFLIFCN